MPRPVALDALEHALGPVLGQVRPEIHLLRMGTEGIDIGGGNGQPLGFEERAQLGFLRQVPGARLALKYRNIYRDAGIADGWRRRFEGRRCGHGHR